MKTRLFILSGILVLSTSFSANAQEAKQGYSAENLRIAIPFNNCSTDTILEAGPGFSAWIEVDDKVILFDTGSDYKVLLENLTKMKLDYNRVTDIFISHNHWDHIYGMPGAAGVKGFQVNTFIPKSSVDGIIQQMPRLKYSAIDSFRELYPGIWTTGEMSSVFQNTTIAEQAMIIDTKAGLVVITGCSHPGIETIVKLVNEKFPRREIKLLVGGFHLERKTLEEIEQISDFLKQSGIKAIAPSHCTGQGAIDYFRKDWRENFIQLFLGDNLLLKI
jgi:7,8-dihydropterin-6-yl-methyl-4-(beta-D-ribofuranosyl)aminobenzene 5'-phosphate synthase